MNDRRTDFLLNVGAGAFTAVGVLLVLLGYLGVRDEANVELQIPYLLSGGIGGLALIGLGALALIQVQMRAQARRFAELTDQLDEWKEAALTEVRTFLESAVIEVEVNGAKAGTGATGSRLR